MNQTCVLCGQTDPGVRVAMIRWLDGDPYGAGPRCRDHDACHARVIARGEPWPVDDGRR